MKFPWGMDANDYARKVTPASQSLRLAINGAAWLGGPAAPAAPSAASKNGSSPQVTLTPASSLAASLAAEEAAKKESDSAEPATGSAALTSSFIIPTSALVESGDYHTMTIDGREYRLAGLAKNNGPESLRLTLRVLCGEPPEERIKYSAMTGQSLYYLGDANLKHKILAIVAEERAEKASYALKLLQSEGNFLDSRLLVGLILSPAFPYFSEEKLFYIKKFDFATS